MIDNGETVTTYKPVKPLKKFQGTLTKRDINGLPAEEGKLFSDWSREGRLSHRFVFDIEPFYVRSMSDLEKPEEYVFMDLFNHQTSSQNEAVRERLKIIAKHGDYDAAKAELREKNLDSRNAIMSFLIHWGRVQLSAPCRMISYTTQRIGQLQ